MARIRTIKPEFFKHHELFLAEMKSKLPLRVSFSGLWICCDKEGRFKWKPMQLKLDVVPYDECDFEDILIELSLAGFIKKYQFEEKEYGYIPSFKDHQRITGTEASGESKLPDPKKCVSLETTRKQQGNTLEIPNISSEHDVTYSFPDGSTLETTRKHFGNTLDDWKGKERKGKEGKGTITWEMEKQSFFSAGDWQFVVCRETGLTVDEFDILAKEFITQIQLAEDYKPLKELKKHFINWYNIKKRIKENGWNKQDKITAYQKDVNEKIKNFKHFTEPDDNHI